LSFFQIRQLDETATRLMQTHSDTADQTYAKQLEINEAWQQLTTKANSRKEKLLDSYDLQRFLSDYRDLMSWINSMMGLVANDELGRDVTSAEALLERHQVKQLVPCIARLRIKGVAQIYGSPVKANGCHKKNICRQFYRTIFVLELPVRN